MFNAVPDTADANPRRAAGRPRATVRNGAEAALKWADIPTSGWYVAAQDAAEWNRRVNSVRPLKFQREVRLVDADADADAVASTTARSLSRDTRAIAVASAPNRGGREAQPVLAAGQRRGDADAAGDAAGRSPKRSRRQRGLAPSQL